MSEERELDVWQVLNVIVAEFESDPKSIQCFDRRVVDRAIRLNRDHKAGTERAMGITQTREGDRVKLDMSRDDYNTLMLLLGVAAGSPVFEGGEGEFWNRIHFTNELNRTNPNYTPYEIPLKFWREKWGPRP